TSGELLHKIKSAGGPSRMGMHRAMAVSKKRIEGRARGLTPGPAVSVRETSTTAWATHAERKEQRMKVNQWTIGLAAVGLVSIPASGLAEEKMSPVLTALPPTSIA